jgi:hypothetical protein
MEGTKFAERDGWEVTKGLVSKLCSFKGKLVFFLPPPPPLPSPLPLLLPHPPLTTPPVPRGYLLF